MRQLPACQTDALAFASQRTAIIIPSPTGTDSPAYRWRQTASRLHVVGGARALQRTHHWLQMLLALHDWLRAISARHVDGRISNDASAAFFSRSHAEKIRLSEVE